MKILVGWLPYTVSRIAESNILCVFNETTVTLRLRAHFPSKVGSQTVPAEFQRSHMSMVPWREQ